MSVPSGGEPNLCPLLSDLTKYGVELVGVHFVNFKSQHDVSEHYVSINSGKKSLSKNLAFQPKRVGHCIYFPKNTPIGLVQRVWFSVVSNMYLQKNVNRAFVWKKGLTEAMAQEGVRQYFVRVRTDEQIGTYAHFVPESKQSVALVKQTREVSGEVRGANGFGAGGPRRRRRRRRKRRQQQQQRDLFSRHEGAHSVAPILRPYSFSSMFPRGLPELVSRTMKQPMGPYNRLVLSPQVVFDLLVQEGASSVLLEHLEPFVLSSFVFSTSVIEKVMTNLLCARQWKLFHHVVSLCYPRILQQRKSADKSVRLFSILNSLIGGCVSDGALFEVLRVLWSHRAYLVPDVNALVRDVTESLESVCRRRFFSSAWLLYKSWLPASYRNGEISLVETVVSCSSPTQRAASFIRSLLELGEGEFSVRDTDDTGATALHNLVGGSSSRIGWAKRLLSLGFDPEMRNRKGMTPLRLAILCNDFPLMQVFCSHLFRRSPEYEIPSDWISMLTLLSALRCSEGRLWLEEFAGRKAMFHYLLPPLSSESSGDAFDGLSQSTISVLEEANLRREPFLATLLEFRSGDAPDLDLLVDGLQKHEKRIQIEDAVLQHLRVWDCQGGMMLLKRHGDVLTIATLPEVKCLLSASCERGEEELVLSLLEDPRYVKHLNSFWDNSLSVPAALQSCPFRLVSRTPLMLACEGTNSFKGEDVYLRIVKALVMHGAEIGLEAAVLLEACEDGKPRKMLSALEIAHARGNEVIEAWLRERIEEEAEEEGTSRE